MTFNLLEPSPRQLLMGMGSFANTSVESFSSVTTIDSVNGTDEAGSSQSSKTCQSSGVHNASAAKFARSQSGRFPLIETKQANRSRARAQSDLTFGGFNAPKPVVKRAGTAPLEIQTRKRAGSLPLLSLAAGPKGFKSTLNLAATNIKNKLMINRRDPSLNISPPTPTTANGFKRFELNTTNRPRTFISLADAQALRAAPNSTCRLEDFAPPTPVGQPSLRNILNGVLLLAPPPPRPQGEGHVRLMPSPGKSPQLTVPRKLPAQAHSATIHSVGDIGSDIDFSDMGSSSKSDESPTKRSFSFDEGDDRRLMPDRTDEPWIRDAKGKEEADLHYAAFNRIGSNELKALREGRPPLSPHSSEDSEIRGPATPRRMLID